ncbi:MAG: TetR/AcrR family transcriptional regulator [bacterium]
MMTDRPQNPLQEARRKAYRGVILAAAERVFADRGFDGTRIQAVADEAGVSVGTIYGVFGSKSELFSAVLTHRLPELLEVASMTAVNATTTMDRLLDGTDAYIMYLLEHPDYLRIHLLEHSWGLGPTRATTEQLTAFREGLDLQAQVLQAAMDEGVVIQEDPYRLGRCIMAMHQVQLWDWIESGMQENPREVADRIRRLFTKMLCIDAG